MRLLATDPASAITQKNMYELEAKYVYGIQSGFGDGSEDVTEKDTRRKGGKRLEEYRDNGEKYPHKLIARSLCIAIQAIALLRE